MALTLHGAGDALKKPDNPVKYYIHRWVPRDGYTLMAAAPGACKTWLGISAAISISLGIEWMGRKTTKCKVLYCALEPKDDVEQRVRAYARGMGVEPTNDLQLLTDPLVIDGDLAELEAAVVLSEAELLVIDPIINAIRHTNENDNAAVRACTERLTTMLSKRGCGLVMLHHTAKGFGSPDYHVDPSMLGRGAGDWGAAASSVIGVSRDSAGTITMKQHKLTQAPKLAPIKINMASVLKEQADCDTIDSVELNLLETVDRARLIADVRTEQLDRIEDMLAEVGNARLKDIVEEMPWSRSTVQRALDYGIERGRIFKPSEGIYSLP